MALSNDATGLSAVCDCGFPDRTPLLIFHLTFRCWMKNIYLAIQQEHTFLCHNFDSSQRQIHVQVAI